MPIRATIGYLVSPSSTSLFQSLLSARRKSDEKTSQRRVVLGRAPRASRAPQTRAVRRRVVEPGCLRDRARARTARCSSRACKAASCATPATCAGTCPFSACDGHATCATTSVRVSGDGASQNARASIAGTRLSLPMNRASRRFAASNARAAWTSRTRDQPRVFVSSRSCPFQKRVSRFTELTDHTHMARRSQRNALTKTH